MGYREDMEVCELVTPVQIKFLVFQLLPQGPKHSPLHRARRCILSKLSSRGQNKSVLSGSDLKRDWGGIAGCSALLRIHLLCSQGKYTLGLTQPHTCTHKELQHLLLPLHSMATKLLIRSLCVPTHEVR